MMGGVPVQVKVVPGQATKKIAGYTCQQYTITAGDSVHIEQWMTKDLPCPPQFYDAQKAQSAVIPQMKIVRAIPEPPPPLPGQRRGLNPNGTWRATGENYLFPRLVLSRLFRGKFLAGLVRLYERGALDLGGAGTTLADPDVFRLFKDRLYSKDWVVYAKPPFAGPEQVYRYLGRYTHRIAITNARLEAFGEGGIRFRTKHGKTATLKPEEFIRRFLLHVLPDGLHKIRHYGLLAAGNLKGKLELARCALATLVPVDHAHTDDGRESEPHVEIDLPRCPQCTVGTMVRRPLPGAGTRSPLPTVS